MVALKFTEFVVLFGHLWDNNVNLKMHLIYYAGKAKKFEYSSLQRFSHTDDVLVTFKQYGWLPATGKMKPKGQKNLFKCFLAT